MEKYPQAFGCMKVRQNVKSYKDKLYVVFLIITFSRFYHCTKSRH